MVTRREVVTGGVLGTLAAGGVAEAAAQSGQDAVALQAGLSAINRALGDLKSSLERWRSLPPESAIERNAMLPLLQSQAAELELAAAEPAWPAPAELELARRGRIALDELRPAAGLYLVRGGGGVGEAIRPTQLVPVVDVKAQHQHIAARLQRRGPTVGRWARRAVDRWRRPS